LFEGVNLRVKLLSALQKRISSSISKRGKTTLQKKALRQLVNQLAESFNPAASKNA
jgi:hypothetical protein